MLIFDTTPRTSGIDHDFYRITSNQEQNEVLEFLIKAFAKMHL